ncbi:MAG: DUF3299 domain-containing protein [Planctomycetota bacterium]
MTPHRAITAAASIALLTTGGCGEPPAALTVEPSIVETTLEAREGQPAEEPAVAQSDSASPSAPPPPTPDNPAAENRAAETESAPTRFTSTTVATPANSPPSDRLLAKTFDDIKFDIEPDAPFDRAMLTQGINQLDGERIRIRGYILPTARTRGIKQFVLVRDNQECCFGPGAALYDCILVEMLPGETAEFSMKPVAVEGRFAIREFPGPDGRPLAIYRLAGEAVTR